MASGLKTNLSTNIPGLTDGIFFKPKIPFGVNFLRPWNGKGWYILWPFGIYYSHLVHFMAIW
jgi:hypothetical protein